MPTLPQSIRLVYHESEPHPREVPLADIYLDLPFPPGLNGRPYVLANMVQTLDGQAVLRGSAYTIGTDVDHYLLRQLRVNADAVLSGAGTVRHDDVIITTHPHLQERRAARGQPRNPLSVVVTATCAFSDEVLTAKRFFRRADLNRLIVTTDRAAPDDIARVRGRGVEVEVVEADAAGEVDLDVLLRFLREERGARRVLCEGGPTLLTALARRGLLDELFVTTTLRLGGDPHALRIVNLPVTDQSLQLISEMHYADDSGVHELYLRFQFPGVSAGAGSGS
jgi:riboflavin-specific deaminase-like protein